MKRAKAFLKNLFSAGKRPVDTDYGDLIDSFVHIDDQQAVDAQAVNTVLQQYDTNLKQRNNNAVVDSLGDVLFVLGDFNDTNKLSTSPALSFTQQTTGATDATVFNSPNNLGATKWLVSDVLGINQALVIQDIQVKRYFISSGGDNPNFIDVIVGLKLGIGPKTVLQSAS